MSGLILKSKNIYEGTLDIEYGAIGKKWKEFGADIVIGHPTFKNHESITKLLKDGIKGALENFSGRKVAFIVSDGTYNHNSSDKSTINASLKAAEDVFGTLSDEEKEKIMVIATPYDGYQDDKTPGKGSALKLIFEEMGFCNASFLMLADGDLKNDMKEWQKVYKKVEDYHNETYGTKSFFITAAYARHFIDASLTRFIVGPLTTLMGQFVPGGISGDIVLSAGAVEHERKAKWNVKRRKYGTDISTTFDNIADKDTVIYEVYLGAKLHDITDEGKLSVMPGEVIGAALERIVHYEEAEGRISRIIEKDMELEVPVTWGPDRTGIDFIDPGYSDVFNIDTKINTLISKFPDFKDNVKKVISADCYKELEKDYEELKKLADKGEGDLVFLNMNRDRWLDILYQAIAYTLVTKDMENVTKALNYLYTAAFLEFCREKLIELDYVTLADIRKVQGNLGVSKEISREFYTKKVNDVIAGMSKKFFAGRKKIKEYTDKLRGNITDF